MTADDSTHPPLSDNPSASHSPPDDSSPHEDDLPEYEELTPELMEDECLRGDVMLRGALVLLALLLGWTSITESDLLVRIRTGEYMLSHGLLPPRTDVFSATAEGRPWINLNWLSDLLLGLLHRFVGMPSLTVFCAACVAAAFVIYNKVTIQGVSTWWGSFCGFLALIALFPVFQPGPSTVTLLGLSVLLLLLARESQLPVDAEQGDANRRFSWSFPELTILFLLWANLDSRCWIGFFLLLLFMAGDAISRWRSTIPQSRRDWGVVLVSMLVASLVTPWPGFPLLEWRTWFRVQAEQSEYGGTREFFPTLNHGLLSDLFWQSVDLFAIASLVLAVLALVTMFLNARRINWGWMGLWLGMNSLCLIDGECVCYAALVNAVIATINGQDWYRNNFSMEYSIDTFSVLWGRGGRAVMVLSYFLTSYLAINGAFMGPQGRRLGLGLDPRWMNRINSLQSHVVNHAYSDRIFPTTPSQGDVLIWLGKSPFVDSRLNLYLSGRQNLLELHRQVRAALFSIPQKDAAKKAPADAVDWKETLSRFEIFDVLVRLWGPIPPYDPMLRMLGSPDWALTGLGAAGANFTRKDPDDPSLEEFVAESTTMQFARRAFRPEKKPRVVELQNVWPVPPSSYNRWLMQPLEVTPNAAQLAAHEDTLLSLLQQGSSLAEAAGLSVLAIRNAREALSETPNHPLAYRVLLHSYRILQQIEQQISQSFGVVPEPGAYAPQILAAAQAAVVAGDNNPLDLERLLEIQLSQQQADLALATLQRLQAAIAKLPARNVNSKRVEELIQLQEELNKAVNGVTEQVEKLRNEAAPRAQLVALAVNGQCPALAVSILEEDRTELQRTPELRMLYASLLLQTGDVETALQELLGLEPLIAGDQSQAPPPLQAEWRKLLANASLATQDFDRAVELWNEDADKIIRSGIQSLLQMPFASMGLPLQYDLWPAFTARVTASAQIEVPERWAQLLLQVARAELIAGRLSKATQVFKRILDKNPHFSQRAIVGFYLGHLTDTDVKILPPPRKEQTDEAGKGPSSSEETASPKSPPSETESNDQSVQASDTPSPTGTATSDQKETDSDSTTPESTGSAEKSAGDQNGSEAPMRSM